MDESMVFLFLVAPIAIALILRILEEKEKMRINNFLKSKMYFNSLFVDLKKAFENEIYMNNCLKVSNQLVSNFSGFRQIDYLIKYFGLSTSVESIEALNDIKQLISTTEKELEEKFLNVRIFRKNFIPKFTMYYISPGGRSRNAYTVSLNQITIDEIVSKTSHSLNREKRNRKERAKLTPELRKTILLRDDFTCQNCHNSIYKEPNLKLEIDHIRPISKGGKTIPENLQVLCWKCNQEKSNKIV